MREGLVSGGRGEVLGEGPGPGEGVRGNEGGASIWKEGLRC